MSTGDTAVPKLGSLAQGATTSKTPKMMAVASASLSDKPARLDAKPRIQNGRPSHFPTADVPKGCPSSRLKVSHSKSTSGGLGRNSSAPWSLTA
jgi:hypothetical protein